MKAPNTTPQIPSRDDHGGDPCPGLPPRLHPDRPAGLLQHRPAHDPKPGGQFRGHRWAETVATSGQVSWPLVGRNRWPLTLAGQADQ